MLLGSMVKPQVRISPSNTSIVQLNRRPNPVQDPQREETYSFNPPPLPFMSWFQKEEKIVSESGLHGSPPDF